MKPLLMLPGWGFTARVFEPVAELLASDYDVVLPRPADSPQQAMQQLAGADTVTLLGWSLGGMQAMQLALSEPDRVERLILIATTPRFVATTGWLAGMPQATFDGFQQQARQDDAAAMQQFVRLNAGQRPDRGSADWLRQQVEPDLAGIRLSGLQALQQTDLRGQIAGIRQAVLVLHAADDRIVPVQAGRWLAERLPAGRLVELPAGGHAFFIRHAPAVADAIRG